MNLIVKRQFKHRVNGKSNAAHTKGDILFYICILALPILQVLIFYFYVNFRSFGMAFQSYNKVTNVYTWDIMSNIDTLKLYKDYIGQWVLNSVIVWIVTSLAGTVLAVIFSFYIYKRRKFSTIFKFILFLPSIIPAILLGSMFKNFISSAIPAYSQGFFADAFDVISITSIFGTEGATAIRLALLIGYSTWISFGSQVLIYTGAMDQIPTEVIEAGRLDGTTFMSELKHIVFPCILASVGTFLVSGVAGLFTNQNNLFNILGYGNQVLEQEKTLGYFMYEYLLKNGEAGYTFTSFLGLICTVVVVPLSFGIRKIVKKVQQ